MKKIILPLLVLMFGLAACQTTPDDFTVASSDAEFESDCIGDNCAVIRFSSPNGNDLVLETDHHVIQIDAQPGVAYSYYVWAGDKEMSDDADLIVHDGQAMVLTEE